MRASMAGGANAKQDLIDKITKLEDARAQLSKELDATKKRHFAEQEQIDGLSQTMQKIEASQGSLGRDLANAETKLEQVIIHYFII